MRQKKITGFAKLALAIVGIFALPALAWAKPLTFKIGDSTGRDAVSFTSDAPIELIAGRTNKLTGSIVIDESFDISKLPLESVFQVDLNSIDTGIEMRNQHMRDNFLQTDKYPQATFKLIKVAATPVKLKSGATVTVNAIGDFTVHGKTVQKSVPVTLTYYGPCEQSEQKSRACDAIVFKATFPVKLQEHDIQRPEMLFQKLADTVLVSVVATARRNAE